MNLSRENVVIANLCSLFEQYGYAQFKMSKFEEYDLYVQNKDFLVSDHVITFTDTNGKLLALKPDVTLSIIKNYRPDARNLKKVYYDESVYRISGGTGSFREITQLGVECLGEVDFYQQFEVLSLAAKSLRILSHDVVLDLSDFGLLQELLSSFSLSSMAKKEILSAIGEKNLHEMTRICAREGVSREKCERLTRLIGTCGAPFEVLPSIRSILSGFVSEEKLCAFEALCKALCDGGYGDCIRVDFSVISGQDYYNGVVFKGFVKGIPSDVLSGGAYDGLMEKMGKKARAIGFAVYLDQMEDLLIEKKEYDVDCIVLYQEKTPCDEIDLVLNRFLAEGKSVLAQRHAPDKITYKELWRFTESGVELLERNA